MNELANAGFELAQVMVFQVALPISLLLVGWYKARKARAINFETVYLRGKVSSGMTSRYMLGG